MSNEKKVTKKMSKKSKMKIYRILFILQVISEVLATVVVMASKMVPTKYLIVAVLILLFYTMIVGMLLFYKRLKWQKIIAVVMSVVMTIAMFAISLFLIKTLSALNGMIDGEVSSDVSVVDEPFTVYLSGSDTRDATLSEDSRSDVNILMIVNPKTKRILLLNTPRDYYLNNPALGRMDKLTHCGNDGIDNSMAALSELYDVDIDFYGQINFSGFETLIDELGGIDIDSPVAFKASNYPYTQFSQGVQHVNGADALAFARERYSFAGGDNTRGTNQMQVITAVINEVTHDGVGLLMNYGGIMDSLEGMFKTSLQNGDISSIVKMQLNDMAEWDIESYAVTGTGANRSTSGGNAYVMIPDESTVEEAKAKIASVVNGEPAVVEEVPVEE